MIASKFLASSAAALLILNWLDYASTALALRVPGAYETNPMYGLPLVLFKSAVLMCVLAVCVRVRFGLWVKVAGGLAAWFFGLAWALMVANNLWIAFGL